MPQVSRTANDLIISSLYLVGELGVGETADSFMLSTGLELINEILDGFSADSIYVPFLTEVNFTMIPGQNTYSVSDIVPADIVADRIVDLTFGEYIVNGTYFPGTPYPYTFPFTVDLATNNLITPDLTVFPTGTPVTILSTQQVPLPLVQGVTYYVIALTPTNFQLARSAADALAGIGITMQSVGLGTNVLTAYTGPVNNEQTYLTYPLEILNKFQYYNIIRQGGFVGRPGFVFLNKQPTKSFITFYPGPDQPYLCKLQLKLMLNNVIAQQDLTFLPPYYYGFLKYALARRFLAYYPSANWPETNEKQYNDYFDTLKNANEVDLTINPSNIMNNPEPFYWAQILAY